MARDDRAADSIPVALVATIVIIALITGLAAFGLKNVSPAVQLAATDRQADAVANDCRLLLSMAPRDLDDPCSPQGAVRIVELDLPEGLEYLSFGSDPDAAGGHPGTIYYKVCGTKKAIVVDETAEFRAIAASPVVFRAGRCDCKIEYGRNALGHRYLLVSSPG